MRTIEISVSRSFAKDQLKEEFKKKSPDGTFTAGPVDREVPSNLQEAVQVEKGEDRVYDFYLKQKRLDLQNELAEQIASKVIDPAKTNRRQSKAVKVDLA